MRRNSLQATTERQGRSHSTEAWQLPPPANRRDGGVTGGEGGSYQNAGGAYLGLFRPPGDAKAAMGFHMCVAVIPSSEEGGAGAVAETFFDAKRPPDQEPGNHHANKVCPITCSCAEHFFSCIVCCRSAAGCSSCETVVGLGSLVVTSSFFVVVATAASLGEVLFCLILIISMHMIAQVSLHGSAVGIIFYRYLVLSEAWPTSSRKDTHVARLPTWKHMVKRSS